MSFRQTWFFALAIVFLFAPRIVVAADFPAISDADLKMTSVPGYPGASAAVLYREEVFDDIRHAARISERIKILTDEGKKYADVVIPFDRSSMGLTAVGGRTIHSDGKVISFEGKPFQKTIMKGKGIKYLAKTFTLPDVQVGSIIEFQYTLIYADRAIYPPFWIVQDELWQKQAHFRFYMYADDVIVDHQQIARGVSYTWSLPKGMEIKHVELPTHQEYMDLVADNIPPFVEEPYMPDSDQFKANVHFYYRIGFKAEDYWNKEVKFWTKDVEKFVGKRDGIDQALATIIQPGDTAEQKARKIYAFVIGLDNDDFLPERTETELKTLGLKDVRGASDVLSQKRGDPEDLNRLFIAMARSAGLHAFAMRVTSRQRHFFDPAYLEFKQLNDEITVLQLDGKEVYLDPGAKFCPFGQLDWRHTITKGYRQTEDKPMLSETPDTTYKDAMLQRIARFKVKPDLTIEGPMRVVFSGFFAISHRQAAIKLDDAGRKKELEEEVRRWLPVDAEVKLTNTPNWMDVNAPLSADFQVSAIVASSAGKRALFPGQTFHFGERPMFPHANRTNGIYFYYPSREIDDVEIALPSGVSVETLPKKEAVQLNYAMYVSEYTGSGNAVKIYRDLAMNGLIFGKESYTEIKGFYDKVKAADEQQIVLRGGASVAAGN